MRLALLSTSTAFFIAVFIVAAPISDHELDITTTAYQLERRKFGWGQVLVGLLGVAGGSIVAGIFEKVTSKSSASTTPSVVTVAAPASVAATVVPAVATAAPGTSDQDVNKKMIETLQQMQEQIEAGRKHDQEQDAILQKLTAQFQSVVQMIKEDREHDRLQDKTLTYLLEKLYAANITATPEEVQKALRTEVGLNQTQLSQPIGMVAKQYVKTHDIPVCYQLNVWQRGH